MKVKTLINAHEMPWGHHWQTRGFGVAATMKRRHGGVGGSLDEKGVAALCN